MDLTIFGGKGFVGSAYARRYPGIVNARSDYEVRSRDVLYLISTVHNYNVFDQPLLDIATNLGTLVRVLESWRRYQAGPAGIDGYSHNERVNGVFNFVSSWFVYGFQQQSHDVGEDAICDPRGFYSITKRCAEQLLASYCETYNLRYRILRLGSVIGPGDVKASAKKNAVQWMVNCLAKNQDVEVYGDGRSYRDYIHVDDCARAMNLVLTRGALDEVYNIGNGASWSLDEIVGYAARMLRSKSRITYVEPKMFHKKVQVESFYMNVGKLRALGYEPRYTGSALFDSLLEDTQCSI